ncbi:MAG: ribose-5-phosphate isomerase [Candidatus Atelocyanobacterium thalassa isolate SIO64986]|uniref:Ribose-5-phosphate isomerase A n=1 Tax=Candidatus Atelocyanobacterium thalassa isolate SIO64986 TaxID=1527444 RepID=A0A086CGR6_9CHRO|nr:MAG: ribose-5-phosphate isomerase [Candidatus Atelocyanobacterium thalassa isolate SIO64986]
MTDPIVIMKQQVGKAAAEYIESNSIIGLGTGSTTAYAIEHIGKRLQSGSLKNIIGITTSFQAEVLAKKYNIPLSTLDMVDHIDIAIDGADEVDPRKNLIKGGGAAHTQEKIVDSLAKKFIVVVDGNKIVDSLGSTVPVPVEVIPKALTPVMKKLKELGGNPDLRMGIRKAGPIVTDQGNLIIDTKFDYIDDPKSLETIINNIPGVLDNGLFVGVANLILIGEIVDNIPVVKEF